MPKIKYTARFESVKPHLQKFYYSLKSAQSLTVFDRWNEDHVLFLNRLDDISLIWSRMRAEFRNYRKRHSTLAHNPFSYTNRQRFDADWKLVWQLRVDIESFYVYANILLAKFLAISKLVFGQDSRGIRFHSFGSFADSLRKARNLKGPLVNYRQQYMPRLDWLQTNVCFYRDKFIMHAQSPYQESVAIELEHGLIVIRRRRQRLHTNVETKAEELRNTLKRGIPALRRASSSHEIAQTIFGHLHRIRQEEHRQAAEAIVQAIGVDSPPLFKLSREMVSFLAGSLDYLTHAVRNPAKR